MQNDFLPVVDDASDPRLKIRTFVTIQRDGDHMDPDGRPAHWFVLTTDDGDEILVGQLPDQHVQVVRRSDNFQYRGPHAEELYRCAGEWWDRFGDEWK